MRTAKRRRRTWPLGEWLVALAVALALCADWIGWLS